MVADFMNALFVQFLAELADRNFEVILFLSSWGPFWGMRTRTRTIESVLVVVGVSVGFIIRAVTIALIGYEDNTLGTVGSNWATALSPMILWFLVWRAYSHYSSADALAELEKQRQAVHDDGKGQALAPAPAAMEAGETASDNNVSPLEVEKPSVIDAEDMREPKAMAFFVPLMTTLLVSISDPLKGSQYGSSGWTVWVAICMGSILASTLAVLAGTLLEGWISEKRYLLCASVTLSLSATAATSRLAILGITEL